jgi:hypothetical protein
MEGCDGNHAQAWSAHLLENTTNRRTVGEKSFGEVLIDQDHLWLAEAIVLVEVAAVQKRNSESVEESRHDIRALGWTTIGEIGRGKS